MTELLHYSRKPFHLEDMGRPPQLHHSKPHGLWVSEGTAWKDWCLEEHFELQDLAYTHVVELQPDARILTITGVQEFDRFTEAYAIKDEVSRIMSGPWSLDWPAVADAYSGILIIPYLWERRLEVPWYYGWDVASGCIWEPTAVKSISIRCPGPPHHGHASSDWYCPYERA